MLMNYFHNNNYFYNVLVTIVETEQRLEKNKYMLKNTWKKHNDMESCYHYVFFIFKFVNNISWRYSQFRYLTFLMQLLSNISIRLCCLCIAIYLSIIFRTITSFVLRNSRVYLIIQKINSTHTNIWVIVFCCLLYWLLCCLLCWLLCCLLYCLLCCLLCLLNSKANINFYNFIGKTEQIYFI